MKAHVVPTQTEAMEESDLRFEGDRHCFIVFVGGEPFGLPVDRVQTIFQIDAITPVPLGPREILGLVNLRGKIVTAVCLRRCMQMQERASKRARLAIGIEHRGENFALVVDEVGDVIILDPEQRIPLPPHLDHQRMKLTSAVYRLDRQILSLLDMSSLFDFQRRN